MTKLPLIAIGFTALFFAAAFVVARISQAASPQPGPKDRLRPCPDSPNCVSSENNTVAPIPLEGQNSQDAWKQLQQIISRQGGHLQEVQPTYLWATYKTPVFGFVDDVEARLDSDARVIHLRSASRVGYYDFNTNRKRLLQLKSAMQHALTNSAQMDTGHE